MGSFSASYCRLGAGPSPASIIASLMAAAQPFSKNSAACSIRFRYRENNPWIVIQFLSVRSLDNERAENILINALMAVEPFEWISMMSHGSSSSGIYVHWVNGWLRRYLFGSDCTWVEIHGKPEAWEEVLFKDHSEPWEYTKGTCTPLDDTTIWDLAEYLELPGAGIDILNPPAEYWTLDIPFDETFSARQKAATD